jgi:hypothetical protein
VPPRLVIPAAMFQNDIADPLAHFGDHVIRRSRDAVA